MRPPVDGEVTYDPDPLQNAITAAAMREVGAHTLKVRPTRPGDMSASTTGPRQIEDMWVAVFVESDRPVLMYGGYVHYGGETRDEALEQARRIASKWDWEVVDS